MSIQYDQRLAHFPENKYCRLDPEAGEDAVLPVSVEQAVLEGRLGLKVDIIVVFALSSFSTPLSFQQQVPMLVGVDETEGAWRGVNLLGNDVVLDDFLQHYHHVLPLVLGLGSQVLTTSLNVKLLIQSTPDGAQGKSGGDAVRGLHGHLHLEERGPGSERR